MTSVKVQPPLDPPAKKTKADKQEKKGLMSLLEDVIKSPSNSDILPSSDSVGTRAEIKKQMNNYLCLELESSEILCSGGMTIADTFLTCLSLQRNTFAFLPL